eukprot:GDKI01029920.1.p2 GENE.GDKI01029920.1~~GDKI01029920.1.p2  ORF type:complete len:118 (-),score=48.02 GDKI01029920.1:318-629(-)
MVKAQKAHTDKQVVEEAKQLGLAKAGKRARPAAGFYAPNKPTKKAEPKKETKPRKKREGTMEETVRESKKILKKKKAPRKSTMKETVDEAKALKLGAEDKAEA